MRTMLIESRWQYLTAALTIVGVTFAYWYWSTNATRLNAAINNLHSCERLAEEIRDLQRAPQTAKTENWSQEDLSGAIEASATDAQLARDRILRIDPQGPRRLAKTDYIEQATEVELTDVTIRQLVDFLFAISGRDDQLENGTLRLRVPHRSVEDSPTELWLADVVLTQRIYSPKSSRR